jgi:hypothetical protein
MPSSDGTSVDTYGAGRCVRLRTKHLLNRLRPRFVQPQMRRIASLLAVVSAFSWSQVAEAQPERRGTKLVVLTPSPTQPAQPGLRLRTMVRPADHLWIGPDVPAYVPLEVGTAELDLLDPAAGGGLVAIYRERFDSCNDANRNCEVIVKRFDAAGREVDSIALAPFLSRRDLLEVQDVRVEGSVLYFNEACLTYSVTTGGRCSSLVAFDLTAKRVLWRTRPLLSNNEFKVIGPYLVAAYGFTGEPARISIIRRSDGAILNTQRLPGANFEMSISGDTLTVQIYQRVGAVNFRLTGFSGPTPTLVSLPTTPPNPNETPQPYNPPLRPDPSASRFILRHRAGF